MTNADELTDKEMMNIAREMNLSETAFVLRPSSNEADVKLRFFTSSGDEVKFCGHATVGTLFQLAKRKMFGLGKPGKNDVRVETNAGILPMSVTNKNGRPTVSFSAPQVDMQPYRLQAQAFAKEFGVPLNFMKPDGTVLIDKNLNYVYVPAASLKVLSEQVFNFDQIRAKFSEENIVVFCLFSQQTVSSDAHLHARGLAPNVGIDEDPFTGSMQAGLIHAAKQNGYIEADKELINTEQGYSVGRPGFAQISHNKNNNELLITANAVQVFSTKLEM